MFDSTSRYVSTYLVVVVVGGDLVTKLDYQK